jgi:hypothetical protein
VRFALSPSAPRELPGTGRGRRDDADLAEVYTLAALQQAFLDTEGELEGSVQTD